MVYFLDVATCGWVCFSCLVICVWVELLVVCLSLVMVVDFVFTLYLILCLFSLFCVR